MELVAPLKTTPFLPVGPDGDELLAHSDIANERIVVLTGLSKLKPVGQGTIIFDESNGAVKRLTIC